MSEKEKPAPNGGRLNFGTKKGTSEKKGNALLPHLDLEKGATN